MTTGLENLKIYQMARKLELRVHNVTSNFPGEEKYRSVNQLKRSTSSITNNIAEAYHKQSLKEKIHILRDTVICEAEETRSNLRMCSDKKFTKYEDLTKLIEDYTQLMKATHGYIRFLKNRLN